MEILAFLYMTTGFIAVFSYITQMRSLLLDTTKSLSISKSSWLIWSYTSVVAFVYAVMAVGDAPLMLITGVNSLGCLLVTSVVLYNQYCKEDGISILQKMRGEVTPLITDNEENIV